MDREEFVSLYNSILKGDAEGSLRSTLIQRYIQEEGSEELIKNSEMFLAIITQLPPLYTHCLNHVINHYKSKFSVVELIKHDYNSMMNNEHIILAY